MPFSLGSVYFNLGADTSGLNRSINDLRAVEREVNNYANAFDQVGRTTNAVFRRQEAAATSALQKTLQFTAAVRNSGADTGTVQRAHNALNDLTNEMARGILTATQFQRSNETFTASLGRLQREFRNTSTVLKDLDREIRSHASAVGSALAMVDRDISRAIRSLPRSALTTFGTTMKDLASSTILLTGPLSGIAVRMNALASIFNRNNIGMASFVAGLGLGAFGAIKLAGAIFDVSKSFQGYEAALKTVYASQGSANESLNYAIDLANRAGVSIGTLIPEWTRFAAAVKGSALEGSKARDVFETFAQVGSKLHFSQEEMGGILKALDQMVSKGQVFREELVGQLGEHLPGALRLSAEAMGVTTAELNKMLSQGQVMSDVFLPKLAEVVRNTFDIQLGGSINNVNASIAKLSNHWQEMLYNADKSIGVTGAITKAFDRLTDVLISVTKNFSNVGAAIAAVGVGFSILAIPTMIRIIGGLASAVAGLATSFGGLALAMGANPVGATIIGVSALVAAIAGAVYTFNNVKAAIDDVKLSQDQWIDSQGNLVGALNSTDMVMNKMIDTTNSLTAGERLMAETDTAATNTYIKNTSAMVESARQRTAALAQALSLKITQLKSDTLAGPEIGTRFGMVENKDYTAKVAQIKELQDSLKTAQDWTLKLETSQSQLLKGDLGVDLLKKRFDDAFGLDTQNKIKGTDKQVANLLNETKALQAALAKGGSAGVEELLKTKNMGRAQDMIRGLSQDDLKELSIQLHAAGYAGATLDDQLAKLITTHDMAEKAVNKLTTAHKEHAKAIKSVAGAAVHEQHALEDWTTEMDQMQRRLAAMMQGPTALDQFDKERAAEDHAERFSKALRNAGFDADFVKSHYQQMLDVLRKTDAFEHAERAMNMLKDAGASAIDTMTNSLVDMATTGKLSMQSLMDTVRQIAADILKTFMQLAVANPIKNALFGLDMPTLGGGFGGLGGLFGGIGSIFGKLFGGGRADGGPVTPGKIYMVGERGPEPFIPRSAGTILPTGSAFPAAAGPQKPATAYVNVDINSPQTDRQIFAMISAGVAAGMKQVQENMPSAFADYNWRHG
jgi:tape measure domain-containing protein